MGRHSEQGDRRLAHTALLTLSILSAGSPIGLIMASTRTSPPETKSEQTLDSLDDSWLALPQGKPNLNLELIDKVAAQPTSSSSSIRAANPTSTTSTTSTTSSNRAATPTQKTRPVPTVTTKTTQRTTVAQRQIARANTNTSTRTTTSPAPAPAPKRATTTTTTTTTAKPAPSSRTTTRTQTTTAPKSTATATTTQKEVSAPAPALTSSSVGSRIVTVAKTYVGRNLPYRMGGDSLTTGIDCSHFVWRVLKEAGLNVPYRSSSGLAAWTASTRTKNPQPGDLVLYDGHVGIYAGDGMMVHHGKPGGAFFIKVYTNNFIGYGRMPL